MSNRIVHDEPGVRPALRAWTLAALAIATIAAFAGVFRADWILFDDPTYVVENRHIFRGLRLEGLQWILTHPHGGNFHPLTSISHMLDAQLFGLGARGPHIVNLALHVANVLVLCVVLARYTGRWWRSAVVAALFALHPLRVESVAWISERKDVLSTLFFLIALEAYLRWVRQPSRGRQAWLCLWFVLGLLAKPMLVTLPFVLLLLDFWPLGRLRQPLEARDVRPAILEKWPLFVLSIASSIVTYAVQHAAGAVMSAQSLPLAARLSNAVASYGRYLWATIWPHDLAVYYPLPDRIAFAPTVVAAAVLLLITFVAWRARAREPGLVVGWLWFIGTLVPVIGIVQVGAQSFADRYTYIPSIGLFVAAVWTVADATRASRGTRTAAGLTAVALVVASGIATAHQVGHWKNTRTLFTHALAVTQRNAIAHQNLGNALFLDGEIDAAIEQLEEALKISPSFPDAHHNLGSALGAKKRYEEAIAHFRAALRGEDKAGTHFNLGFALMESGHRDEAILEYQKSLELDPGLADAHAALGAAFAARNRLDEAAAHLLRALELAPEDVETHRSLAITRTLQGRVEEGIAEYRQVLARVPKDLDALNNIAWIRATHADPSHRNGAGAVKLAEEARDAAKQENHVLFSTLAAAYAEVGRFEDAVAAATHAVELARAADDAGAASRFSEQLERYRAREPFHQ